MSQDAMEQHWETSDPLLLGYADVDHLCLMYDTTDGLDWPHPDGPLLLKRRTLHGTPQAWAEGLYCGMAGPDASTVKNWSSFPHVAEQGYQYAVFRSFGNGYVSAAPEPVRVDFDDGGDRITPALPKWPEALKGVAIAGGKFKLTWAYNPWGQGGWPKDFAVHLGSSPATIIYDTPLATVDFVASTRKFEYLTGAFQDGVGRAFAVRARNSDAVAEQNELTTPTLIARVTGPDPASVCMGSTRRPVR